MNRSIFALLLLFFTTACSGHDEVIEEYGEKVVFNSHIDDYTRAVSTFGPIDLASLKTSADGFAVSTSGLASTQMNNLIVKYSNNVWTYTGNYYWPISATQNATFAAYAPAGTTGVTLTSSGITVTGFTPASSPASQIDLLYAAPATRNRTNSASGVPLTFNHLLTQVVFSVTTQIAGVVTITSIEVTVPSATGAYNGTTWTNSGSTVTYTIPVNSSVTLGTVVATPILMVPKGTIPSGTIVKTNYSALGLLGLSVSKDLSTLNSIKSWQPGYKVTYNSILGLTRAGVSEVDMEVTEEFGFD